jgi:hypothetical protein
LPAPIGLELFAAPDSAPDEMLAESPPSLEPAAVLATRNCDG